jgi:hypothetical protein
MRHDVLVLALIGILTASPNARGFAQASQRACVRRPAGEARNVSFVSFDALNTSRGARRYRLFQYCFVIPVF